jgi:hypothetical protein
LERFTLRGVHLQALAGATRKSSFYKLNSASERYAGFRSEKNVEVIQHDHEFVEKVFPLAAAVERGF